MLTLLSHRLLFSPNTKTRISLDLVACHQSLGKLFSSWMDLNDSLEKVFAEIIIMSRD